MSWMENFQLAQVGGAFWPALGVAFLGVILLWILRPFLAKRLGGRAAILLGVNLDTEPEMAPKIVSDAKSNSTDSKITDEIPESVAVPAAKALAAYAAQAGVENIPILSSTETEGSIPEAKEAAVPSCPLELSRRIDHIEARIRARRIGIRV